MWLFAEALCLSKPCQAHVFGGVVPAVTALKGVPQNSPRTVPCDLAVVFVCPTIMEGLIQQAQQYTLDRIIEINAMLCAGKFHELCARRASDISRYSVGPKHFLVLTSRY